MADLATLQTRLTEAETALHALLTGSRVQVVARDGRRLEYTSAAGSINQLRNYIGQMQAEIASLTGVASTDWRLNRRAGRPVFG
jgi:hypothetical protein